MASEIRVDKINSLSGVGTVTLSPTGVDISGITTVATFKVGTGVTASSDGDIFATGVCTATSFSGDGSALTGIDLGAVTGATGDFSIADKIVHTGDTNTAIRFPSADTVTVETGGSERLRIDSGGKILAGATSSRNVAGGYAKLQVEATSSEGVSITRTSADNGSVYLTLGKTRNGSACQAGDNIGTISWNPDDGTDLNHPASEIQTLVASGIGGNDVPGHLVFKTNGGATSTTERLRITSDGELVIGMTAAGGAAADARLQVRGDTYARAKIQVLGTHNDDNPVGLTLAKSRSSGNTILGDSDDIGQIDFASNDGNGFHNVGRIMVSHDGSGNGNDDLPSMMRFFTTANGGVTLAERLRISSNGDLLYAQSAYNYACWYKSPTNSSSNAATSNSEVLVYGTAVIANTDVYNTSNGRYTAPVDGLYYIRANGLIDNNASQAGMQLKLYKNGSEYGTQIAYNTYLSEDSPNRYKLLSGTGIMYMDTGDYAQIWATSGMHTSNETNLIVYLIRGTI